MPYSERSGVARIWQSVVVEKLNRRLVNCLFVIESEVARVFGCCSNISHTIVHTPLYSWEGACVVHCCGDTIGVNLVGVPSRGHYTSGSCHQLEIDGHCTLLGMV